MENDPFRGPLDTGQAADPVADGDRAPLRKQSTDIQQDREKHFIPLKQEREKTEWHKISHITCQVSTHPGFLFHMRLELGSQMSS